MAPRAELPVGSSRAVADDRRVGGRPLGAWLSFRARLMAALIVAAVAPVAAFGVVLLAADLDRDEHVVIPILLVAVAGAALLGVLVAYQVGTTLTAPLRRIATAAQRVAAGEPSAPIPVVGDDELADLAESHNRIAADTRRRNGALAALLRAVAEYGPEHGMDALVRRADRDGREIFGLIDCELRLTDPAGVPAEEPIPGEPLPVRAEVRSGADVLGLFAGHLPATRSWEPADQNLLELFTSEVGVALRNAELFGRIEGQNARLIEVDAAKDEFLRGVSHNLQTPLTSIRAYVDQLRETIDDPAADRRLGIVAEQTDRLSRLVRQLLTVSRIEAGALRSDPTVLAVGPRVRRAWEALGAATVPFELRDGAAGWLAVADADQLDQVLWALFDNAVKYGSRGGVLASVRVDETGARLEVTIADHGSGIPGADRDRLFARYARGSAQAGGDGTGLGLYISRELARSMGGELRLEPHQAGLGAAFTLSLPGEPPDE